MPKYKVIMAETTLYEYNIIADSEEAMLEKVYEYQENGFGLEIDHKCDVYSVKETKEY